MAKIPKNIRKKLSRAIEKGKESAEKRWQSKKPVALKWPEEPILCECGTTFKPKPGDLMHMFSTLEDVDPPIAIMEIKCPTCSETNYFRAEIHPVPENQT